MTAAFSQHSISGKIIDNQSQPLPYTNVILYKVGNEANPKGTVSDDNGNYSFKNIAKGNYKISVSTLGFKTEKVKEFQFSSNKTLNF